MKLYHKSTVEEWKYFKTFHSSNYEWFMKWCKILPKRPTLDKKKGVRLEEILLWKKEQDWEWKVRKWKKDLLPSKWILQSIEHKEKLGS